MASPWEPYGEESEGSEGGSSTESPQCPICLAPFGSQDVGTPESCDHSFCLECIQEWAKNVNTCPIDRHPFNLIFARASVGGPIYERIHVDNNTLPSAEDPTFCEVCGQSDREDRLLLCDGCDSGYHLECLNPPLRTVPVEEWFCPECLPIRQQGRLRSQHAATAVAAASAGSVAGPSRHERSASLSPPALSRACVRSSVGSARDGRSRAEATATASGVTPSGHARIPLTVDNRRVLERVRGRLQWAAEEPDMADGGGGMDYDEDVEVLGEDEEEGEDEEDDGDDDEEDGDDDDDVSDDDDDANYEDDDEIDAVQLDTVTSSYDGDDFVWDAPSTSSSAAATAGTSARRKAPVRGGGSGKSRGGKRKVMVKKRKLPVKTKQTLKGSSSRGRGSSCRARGSTKGSRGKRTAGAKRKGKKFKKRKKVKASAGRRAESEAGGTMAGAAARMAGPATVKGRLAGRLGLVPPPSGQTIPLIRRSSVVLRPLEREELTHFSVFGHRNDLSPFESDLDGALASSQHSRASVNARSAGGSAVPGSPRRATSAAATSDADLLGSILESQRLLTEDAVNIRIDHDGSLRLREEAAKHRQASDAPAAGPTLQADVHAAAKQSPTLASATAAAAESSRPDAEACSASRSNSRSTSAATATAELCVRPQSTAAATATTSAPLCAARRGEPRSGPAEPSLVIAKLKVPAACGKVAAAGQPSSAISPSQMTSAVSEPIKTSSGAAVVLSNNLITADSRERLQAEHRASFVGASSSTAVARASLDEPHSKTGNCKTPSTTSIPRAAAERGNISRERTAPVGKAAFSAGGNRPSFKSTAAETNAGGSRGSATSSTTSSRLSAAVSTIDAVARKPTSATKPSNVTERVAKRTAQMMTSKGAAGSAGADAVATPPPAGRETVYVSSDSCGEEETTAAARQASRSAGHDLASRPESRDSSNSFTAGGKRRPGDTDESRWQKSRLHSRSAFLPIARPRSSSGSSSSGGSSATARPSTRHAAGQPSVSTDGCTSGLQATSCADGRAAYLGGDAWSALRLLSKPPTQQTAKSSPSGSDTPPPVTPAIPPQKRQAPASGKVRRGPRTPSPPPLATDADDSTTPIVIDESPPKCLRPPTPTLRPTSVPSSSSAHRRHRSGSPQQASPDRARCEDRSVGGSRPAEALGAALSCRIPKRPRTTRWAPVETSRPPLLPLPPQLPLVQGAEAAAALYWADDEAFEGKGLLPTPPIPPRDEWEVLRESFGWAIKSPVPSPGSRVSSYGRPCRFSSPLSDSSRARRFSGGSSGGGSSAWVEESEGATCWRPPGGRRAWRQHMPTDDADAFEFERCRRPAYNQLDPLSDDEGDNGAQSFASRLALFNPAVDDDEEEEEGGLDEQGEWQRTPSDCDYHYRRHWSQRPDTHRSWSGRGGTDRRTTAGHGGHPYRPWCSIRGAAATASPTRGVLRIEGDRPFTDYRAAASGRHRRVGSGYEGMCDPAEDPLRLLPLQSPPPMQHSNGCGRRLPNRWQQPLMLQRNQKEGFDDRAPGQRPARAGRRARSPRSFAAAAAAASSAAAELLAVRGSPEPDVAGHCKGDQARTAIVSEHDAVSGGQSPIRGSGCSSGGGGGSSNTALSIGIDACPDGISTRAAAAAASAADCGLKQSRVAAADSTTAGTAAAAAALAGTSSGGTAAAVVPATPAVVVAQAAGHDVQERLTSANPAAAPGSSVSSIPVQPPAAATPAEASASKEERLRLIAAAVNKYLAAPYEKGRISRVEHKEIQRKAVNKIYRSKSGGGSCGAELDQARIKAFVESYVEKVIAQRKQSGHAELARNMKLL